MSLCLAISSSWGQNNKSRGNVVTGTTVATPIAISPASIALGASNIEAFRFQLGLVTQLDAGTDFNFSTTDRWFSLGKLAVGGGSTAKTLYGFRIQNLGQGLTMGYSRSNATPLAPTNPFIEWIGNDNTGVGVGSGNLEFLTAANPGGPPPAGAGIRRLAFTLRSDLTALFGEASVFNSTSTVSRTLLPKVEINSDDKQSLFVNSKRTTLTSSFTNDGGGFVGLGIIDPITGVAVNRETLGVGVQVNAINASSNFSIITNASGGLQNFGIQTTASSNVNRFASSNYGIVSSVSGSNISGSINCGVYGTATGITTVLPTFPNTVTTGTYAGYFNGLLYSTSQIASSDSSLKKDVKPELSNIEKLSQLNPVSYNYIQKNEVGLNLPAQLQHGFIAQELEKVYPELVQNLLHPVFNEKKEQTGTKSLKGVNYMGLISVLVASVKELNTEVKTLKEKLASNEKVVVVKNNKSLSNNEIDLINEKGYFLGQNTPNPFKNSTVIEYSLPVNEKNASILIFNLNGQTLKEYKLSETKGSITIDSTVLSKGLYLYSLISDGQEIATKKMLVN